MAYDIDALLGNAEQATDDRQPPPLDANAGLQTNTNPPVPNDLDKILSKVESTPPPSTGGSDLDSILAKAEQPQTQQTAPQTNPDGSITKDQRQTWRQGNIAQGKQAPSSVPGQQGYDPTKYSFNGPGVQARIQDWGNQFKNAIPGGRYAQYGPGSVATSFHP